MGLPMWHESQQAKGSDLDVSVWSWSIQNKGEIKIIYLRLVQWIAFHQKKCTILFKRRTLQIKCDWKAIIAKKQKKLQTDTLS